MTQPDPKLIADLARVVAKYSTEDWRALAEFLRDPENLAELAELAERLGSASRSRAGRVAGHARGLPVRDVLAQVRTRDPARADALDDIWSRLRRRELLPEMRSIRAFAEAAGLKSLEATKRDQAVAEIMRQVVNVPPEQLAAALTDASAPDRVLGDEYGRWVRLILGSGDDRSSEQRLPSQSQASETESS